MTDESFRRTIVAFEPALPTTASVLDLDRPCADPTQRRSSVRDSFTVARADAMAFSSMPNPLRRMRSAVALSHNGMDTRCSD